ncbi:MAG: hypothetical protein WAN93_02695 [Solirubrobacteraceae bacterium]
MTWHSKREWRIALSSLVAMATLALALVGGASVASADGGPVWKITSVSDPTNLPPAGEGELVVSAINVGGSATDGSAITIGDSLPPGLVATAISGLDAYTAVPDGGGPAVHNPVPLDCSTPPALQCTRTAAVYPGDQLIVRIDVAVQPGFSSVVNRATVSGGGTESGASVNGSVTISAAPAGFGLAADSVFTAVSTRQAGAHANVTTSFTMNTSALHVSAGDPRDVRFDLPPGLVGNTVGMPQCTAAKAREGGQCPSDTVIGLATSWVPGLDGILKKQVIREYLGAIYNIAPSPGEPAAFLFTVAGLVPIRLDTSLLSDGNYGVRVTAGNISQAEHVITNYITTWGVPADHNGPGTISPENTGIIKNTPGYEYTIGGSSVNTRVPLLSNPTQCVTPLTGIGAVDPWSDPGAFQGQSSPMGTMTGCNQLSFSASMSMLPDTLQAGAPAGYSLDLHVPQGNEPDGLSEPTVKKVVTTLPMGTVISPSAAWGLAACSDRQFFDSGRGEALPAQPGECPRESQVGTVQIRTPALSLPLTGDVYLATPRCGPCTPEDARDGRMVRLFVQVLGEGESGIVLKLEGTASINQQTGQITATFDNNPQAPFSDFKLTLGGGSRATLANPRGCGAATTSMELTPWSTPFTSEISPSYTFQINEGCVTPRFDPSFVAGTTNIQAGEYSPFTVSFGRSDMDEFLNGVQIQMPPGLLGSLAGVPLCKEQEASQGTCPAASLIGHTQVLTGPGGTPFLVTGGKVFLTEGYRGAPFGLSIVVPAVAGPYTLSGTTGNGTVVVRAAINVDAQTAALTVTSDPLPTELDGIPLQLKVVNVTIDRPAFTLNPTSCAKMAVTATLASQESAGVSVSRPFQVTNCAGLGFKPQFKVATTGRTSRVNGANLDVRLTYPANSVGNAANIASVKVELPKQLPSRLTTLQKACVARTFDANPAGCPAASVIGVAKAVTPILPVALTGPVYFVSNGGEAFPNLIVVLQGYGVRVDLIGDTFINKAGVTSSTFKQVPDVPVNSFELYLPQGPHSALAANGKLCASKLRMPTTFVAHNGAAIHQSTKIAVTHCPKAKAKAKKAKVKKRKAKKADKARYRSAGQGRSK